MINNTDINPICRGMQYISALPSMPQDLIHPSAFFTCINYIQFYLIGLKTVIYVLHIICLCSSVQQCQAAQLNTLVLSSSRWL